MSDARTPLFTPVLIGGCLIMIISFSIRASFGVFQIPIAAEFNWPRAEFSMAIAIQNLAWGFGQPIFGAIAERMGDRKAIILGALTYAAGLVLSSFAVTPEGHQFFEIFVGLRHRRYRLWRYSGRSRTRLVGPKPLHVTRHRDRCGVGGPSVRGAPCRMVLVLYAVAGRLCFVRRCNLALAFGPAVDAFATSGLQGCVGGKPRCDPWQSLSRSELYPDFSGLLFMRLSACLYHRSLSRSRHRDVRGD